MTRRKKNARGALLSGIGAYAIIQMGLLFILMRVAPWLRDAPYALKAQQLQQRLKSDEKPLFVLMLGSSRTTYGLHGLSMEEQLSSALGRPAVVFNFGRPGAGPIYNYLNLRRLVAEGMRPDLLLLEVLPFRLGAQHGPVDVTELYLPLNSLRADELGLVDRYARGGRTVNRSAWWQSCLMPGYEYRQALLSVIMPTFVPALERTNSFKDMDAAGWMARPFVPGDQQRMAVAEQANCQCIRDELDGFRLTSSSAEALEDCLQFCKREGIATVLVLMPETQEFQEWYPAPIWKQLTCYMDILSKRHKVPVIDARNWVRPEHFADSQHVSEVGAVELSRMLGRDVVLPRLRAQLEAGSNMAAGRSK